MWTELHQDLLERFAAKFPPPPYTPPANSNADACREWTRRVAEQFAFTFPREGWGHKSAGGSRPPSTDVIATSQPFVGYDLLLAQGAPGQALSHMPGPENLAGQVFIPVTPTDHIGSLTDPLPPPVQPPVVVPPAQPVCKFDPEAVRAAMVEREQRMRDYFDARFAEIEGRDAAHARRMEELIDVTIKRIAEEANRIVAAVEKMRCRLRF